ncbi:ABC transporter ATP-binding protein [Acidipropionibacterium virtanenii]|uniref:Iron(3+)-hydroxamate import ATP-binding protein FhuC n=1 Tax=Acidipropionibacterium virtanenii TaxID=2057246 RepID=A0A344UPP5_9ACTN|nr:ABC transporter ATP-binding protein [Acidipropionibacterium virtanenii]AXE37243.1 Iron(3+)-hydroxamate import ATP-binding protein FhuC [Acidipropionibacterium virtanenii]
MIEARSLIVRRGDRVVLDHVDLTACDGRTVGVVGPNGAGKSTLVQTMYRALSAAGGKVLVDGADITSMSRRAIARSVAVVSQEHDDALPLTVRDAVGLGRLSHRSLAGYGDRTDRDLVDAALAKVDMTDLADRLVTRLSGGERQRALIARAIVQDADHLILDEPTNHLDISHQFDLLSLVDQVPATTIVVLHDLNLAARSCQELILLDRGRLVASGSSREVLDPGLISRVYGVDVHRIDYAGRTRLFFDPISGGVAS